MKKEKVKPKDRPHYVNNKEFSEAIVEYNELAEKLEKEGKQVPAPSRYIGDCFLRLARRMASSHKYSRYTWKDEMIMDGVEMCVKKIRHFNVKKALEPGVTRVGIEKSQKLNAFSYFSQMIYYTFLQRIEKENMQLAKREELIEHASVSMFFEDPHQSKMYNPSTILDKARNYHNMDKDINLIEEGKYEQVGLSDPSDFYRNKMANKKKNKKEPTANQKNPKGLENFYE